jgi:hypothetical protein
MKYRKNEEICVNNFGKRKGPLSRGTLHRSRVAWPKQSAWVFSQTPRIEQKVEGQSDKWGAQNKVM